MSTQSKALAAAKRKHGKNAFVRFNRKAPDAAGRAKLNQRRHDCAARIKEIDAEMKTLAGARNRLSVAARFVVDVYGDPPSIDQLKASLEAVERLDELSAERTDLRREQDGCYARYRYEAGYFSNGPIPHTAIMHSSDSWAELIQSIDGPEPNCVTKTSSQPVH